jgi:hypothetical protein
MPRGVLPLADRVRSVRVGHSREGFVQFYEFIDKLFRAVVMDVVVAGVECVGVSVGAKVSKKLDLQKN